MKPNATKNANARWLWLMAACLLVVLVAMLMPTSKPEPAAVPVETPKANPPGDGQSAVARWGLGRQHPVQTAEDIVAAKLKKFGTKRRALVHSLAGHYKIDVVPDVEKFFDALDRGDWDETKRLFESLKQQMETQADMHKYWRAILEAYGGAEQVHLWPAQQLLDYGDGILNSLKPGMVYIGGTDPGCFICTMLNETTDGQQHMTLTQNALADNSYLQYLTAIYGDNLKVPTEEEAQGAFNQYVADATARANHDQQFPDEPKQLLPNESVTIGPDGEVNVTGAVAVMGINNLLTQILLQKNPNVSFGLEESFPLSSTYPDAAPLGPIFELRSADAMTEDQAAQAVNYWQNEAEQFQENGETSPSVLKSFSHDADSQANLLANSNFPDEASQAYQTALNLWPSSVEAITGLTRVLAQQGEFDQADQALNSFLQNNPDQTEAVNNLRQIWLRQH